MEHKAIKSLFDLPQRDNFQQPQQIPDDDDGDGEKRENHLPAQTIPSIPTKASRPIRFGFRFWSVIEDGLIPHGITSLVHLLLLFQ